MGVSSSGVSSVRQAPARMDPNMLLQVALHPKETSERLAELTAAEARYAEIVAAHGKVSEIDGILADTKKSQSEARARISTANARAKKIVADAEQKAIENTAVAKDEIERERAILRRTRERTTKGKKDLDLREERFAPLEEELLKKHARLDTALKQAEASKADFDGRIAVIQRCMKEVRR